MKRPAVAVALAAVGYLSWRAGRATSTEPGAAVVDANDLNYLLAHYYDEVLGTPDRAHWKLPLLRAAAGRLADATRPPGAMYHPVLIRPPRPAGDTRDET